MYIQNKEINRDFMKKLQHILENRSLNHALRERKKCWDMMYRIKEEGQGKVSPDGWDMVERLYNSYG